MTESKPLRTYSGLETIVTRPSAASVIAKIAPGKLFAGRYQIEQMLGEGGMGVVYLAKDHNTGQDIVLKLLSPALVAQEAMDRLRSEGLVARQIRHPNVVAVYDIGQISEQPYLTMEYVPGVSLRKWIGDAIRSGREISLENALAIMRPILSGLAEAHRMGVVHRDLKPENILLCGEPGRSDFRLKILDFGIARAINSRTDADTSGGTLGTARYMAPEQETAPDTVGPPADLYSVSAIFYELLMEALPRSWEAPSEHREDIPKAIDVVLERGLKTRARSRFQSADEYLRALDAAAPAGAPAQARTQPAPAPGYGFHAPGLSSAIEAAEVAAKQARDIALRAHLKQKDAQSTAARAQDAANRAKSLAARARETASRAQDAAMMAREAAKTAEASFPGGRVGIWNSIQVWNGTNSQNTNLRWAAQIDDSKTTPYRTVPVRGVCTFADGNLYAGDVKDWMRQGLGVFTFPNGNSYAGEWRNDLYHGLGVLVFSNGWSYAGEFREGKCAGSGQSTCADGTSYAGEWRDDKANGLGVWTWPDSPLERKWHEFMQLKTQVSGNSYAGEWRDDQRNGVGVDTLSTGWSYAGEFQDGKKIGIGVSTFPHGGSYAGEWKDDICQIYVRTFSVGQSEREYSGQHDGYGVLLLNDGQSQKGEWKNGQLNGFGAKFDAQGRATEQGQYGAGQLKLSLAT